MTGRPQKTPEDWWSTGIIEMRPGHISYRIESDRSVFSAVGLPPVRSVSMNQYGG